MSIQLHRGQRFPNLALPDHHGQIVRLSPLTAPDEFSRRLGFIEERPLIVVFSRGFFCPRASFRNLLGNREGLLIRTTEVSIDPFHQFCRRQQTGGSTTARLSRCDPMRFQGVSQGLLLGKDNSQSGRPGLPV